MNSMTLHDLENFYDHLAETLDQVGKEKSTVFLTKLVLLLAHQEQRHPEQLRAAVDDAAQDL